MIKYIIINLLKCLTILSAKKFQKGYESSLATTKGLYSEYYHYISTISIMDYLFHHYNEQIKSSTIRIWNFSNNVTEVCIIIQYIKRLIKF